MFAADSRHAVSAGIDGQLIYWDLDLKSSLRKAEVRDGSIRGIALDNDGRHLVFVGSLHSAIDEATQGVLGFWDLASSEPPRLAFGGYGRQALTLLPDGAIATADNGGIARVWRRSRALAAARELAGAGREADALAGYERALAARSDDAGLLIERGRVLCEIGRSSEADADFARAAHLVPDNPQLFLNAGWWIAGPYAADLNAKTPIEQEAVPDPSQPPPPSGDKPRVWRHVSPGMLGHVELRKAFDADQVGAYALAVVYTQSEKSVVFLAGSDDKARIWLNGRVTLECRQWARRSFSGCHTQAGAEHDPRQGRQCRRRVRLSLANR